MVNFGLFEAVNPTLDAAVADAAKTIAEALDRLTNSLTNTREETIMATLAELKALVEAENTAIGKLVTWATGLSAQIAALAPVQADIDALAATVAAETAAITATLPTTP